MLTTRRAAGAAALALVAGAAAGCSDFLTCNECVTDPNRQLAATNTQYFVGVQSGLWGLLASDMPRVTGLWAQHFRGGLQQYVQIYNYGITEQTTNTFHSSLYTAGGLVDVRRLQAGATAANDKTFLGIAQVQEALLMGTGADLFGDLVYSEALKGTPNPPLDEQMAIYDAVQATLSAAITTNLPSNAVTDIGPRAADLAYYRSGDGSAAVATANQRARWIRLAHTLKARFFLHTAEVRGAAAYQSALNEARLGIQDPADDFVARFSGSLNEENLWYQFAFVQREGYLEPDPFFVGLLEARSDPRLDEYFQDNGTELNESRFAPDFTQPLVTAAENRLIWAEAAYRTGNEPEAREQLNIARGYAGLGSVPGTLSGQALLNEILTEKYIAMFQNIEAWNDYKRTCTPNLDPVDPNRRIPGRLYYDSSERQTNSNMPDASAQPARNDNDPSNTVSDGTGEACRGQ